MKTNLVKPSRVDFEKADIGQIGRILATGDLDSLPEEQRAYYDLDGDGARTACPYEV
ncbi:hypothetical protein NXV26_16010 [Bacteroides fragilis]|nr:hypothetical protein [Bacteroides fragilis]